MVMNMDSAFMDLNSTLIDLNSAFMELLVRDLKEKLLIRRKKEYERMQQFIDDNINELRLISSGRIIEIDFQISSIDEMITQYEQLKMTEK